MLRVMICSVICLCVLMTASPVVAQQPLANPFVAGFIAVVPEQGLEHNGVQNGGNWEPYCDAFGDGTLAAASMREALDVTTCSVPRSALYVDRRERRIAKRKDEFAASLEVDPLCVEGMHVVEANHALECVVEVPVELEGEILELGAIEVVEVDHGEVVVASAANDREHEEDQDVLDPGGIEKLVHLLRGEASR